MLDHLLYNVVDFLRLYPSIGITVFSSIISGFFVIQINRSFGYVGLGCYMALMPILGNIQVLYATRYEIIDLPVFLGTISLSSSFLANDFINEFYGKDIAKKTVYLTFFIQIIFLVNIILTMGHKPLISENFSIPQDIISKNINGIFQTFLPAPRLLIASYAAYLSSQLFEIWLYRAIKYVKFIKNTLILHNISLFFSSVIIDTIVFTSVSFCFLSESPLSYQDLCYICSSAIVIRIFCNFINSLFLKTVIR
ncbi:MAG: queuosine precursor transporter [Holosporales bacterium]|jgi:uncharacterized integral membrane protein (TIGR00697 family)|nr:queuosine precursor transporter [Holosporales bacterium]